MDWVCHRALYSTLGSGILGPTPPRTVCELEAGVGEFAVALARSWAGALQLYVATESTDEAVDALRVRFADESGGVLDARRLRVGEAFSGAEGYDRHTRLPTDAPNFDVVLGAGLCGASPAQIATTLSSLCTPGCTVALLCVREQRIDECIALSSALRDYGFVIERAVLDATTPVQLSDLGTTAAASEVHQEIAEAEGARTPRSAWRVEATPTVFMSPASRPSLADRVPITHTRALFAQARGVPR